MRAEPPSADSLLQAWRAEITRRLLAIMLVLACVLLLVFVRSLTPASAVGGVIVIILLSGLVAWREAPPLARLLVIQATLTFAGATSLYSGDDPGAAAIYLVTGAVLTALLASAIATWSYIAVATGVLLLGAWAEASATTLMTPAPEILSPPIMLLGNAISLAAIGVLLVTSLRSQTRRLSEALAERERSLAALQQAQASLVEASKAELLGQLAGGIAHDMNNALTVILAEADLLERTAPTQAEAIADAVEHASTLTRQLLAIGRRELVQPRAIDLGEAVHGAAAMLRRTLPRSVELHTELAPGVVVRADPNQVRQIILNLGTNAAHAMPERGQISITLTDGPDRARLVVADDGHGIDPATLAHIFEPFFTTKARGVGSGLGLPSVRAIVEGLGGTIACHSEVGVGTRFTLELPRLSTAAQTEPKPASSRPSADRRLDGHRVLVVDDEIRVRAMVTTSLRSAGADVVDVGHADAAIALAEREPQPFDLLWTDVVLPGGGAQAVIAHFAAHSPTTKIVISTGYSDDAALTRDLAAGRYALLRKPFAQAELLELAATLLADEAEDPG